MNQDHPVFFDFSQPCISHVISLQKGYYLFEVWGASGGGPFISMGGFSSGFISIEQQTTFFVYVGSCGEDGNLELRKSKGGCNGGGDGGLAYKSQWYCGGGGGGATDIRYSNSTTALEDRIIVAGGAGGSVSNAPAHGIGGFGGGLVGGSSIGDAATSAGGNQTGGYSFGNGQNGRNGESYSYGGEGSGGGGGGWFGGFSIQSTGINTNSGGGGGSSYNSGHLGCVINPNYLFSETVIKNGNEDFYSPAGTLETGHLGDGYARITLFFVEHHSYNFSCVHIISSSFMLVIALSLS